MQQALPAHHVRLLKPGCLETGHQSARQCYDRRPGHCSPDLVEPGRKLLRVQALRLLAVLRRSARSGSLQFPLQFSNSVRQPQQQTRPHPPSPLTQRTSRCTMRRKAAHKVLAQTFTLNPQPT